MSRSLLTTLADQEAPTASSPTKRSTTSILRAFVTPRKSRASTHEINFANTAPALKQPTYLELRSDAFAPLEPLVPPNPPFYESYSRLRLAGKSDNNSSVNGKGLHRKSISITSFGGVSPEKEVVKKQHRHSGIFNLPIGTSEDPDDKKPNKARSTIDFSILKGVVRDRSPSKQRPLSKDKEKPSEVYHRPTSSQSNYGRRLLGAKTKVETNKENRAPNPTGNIAKHRATGPPPPSPPERAPNPSPAIPFSRNGGQFPPSGKNQSLVTPQSLFTPREPPKSYLQQQRTSHYTSQDHHHHHHPPPSRGSNSSDSTKPSPRQSVDHNGQSPAPKTASEAVASYTPRPYTPSSRKNLQGQGHNIALKTRPKSSYYAPAPEAGFVGDRSKTGKTSSRGSWDSSGLSSDEIKNTGSSSGDSTRSEVSQGSRSSNGSNGSSEYRKMDIDQAFEALMDNRAVALNMRQRLRNLDPRVKQHFINNESELEKLGAAPAPTEVPSRPTTMGHNHTLGGVSGLFGRRPHTGHAARNSISGIPATEQKRLEEAFNQAHGASDATTSKGARPRSRTFGLGKEKERSRSPAKKPKPGDSPSQPPPSPKKTLKLKNALLKQPTSATCNGEALVVKPARAGTVPAAEFVTYLTLAAAPSRKKDFGMKDIEVAKLHKLRLYLRNERLSWVEEFIGLGGMTAIIHVLYRCLDIEWREEHEDSVLHELLLCLKAISASRKALEQLQIVEKEFFTKLVDIIFDEERKGPSEFATRGLVFSLLFTYLAAAPVGLPASQRGTDRRVVRARRLLGYLSDKLPAENKRPIEFIEKIHTKRPYKRWCKEVSNVTKEVFWIFLHQTNVITVEPAEALQGEAYEARHFPKERPPVPAAPYVGGVEWEATTYLATHLDLLNGIIASIESTAERNDFRTDLKNSGWEKVMGGTLRTCKERLHGCSAVHDGLKTWVRASIEDNWRALDVQTGNFQNLATKGGRVGLVQPEDENNNKPVAIMDIPAGRRLEVVDAPQVTLDLPTLNLGPKAEANGWAF